MAESAVSFVIERLGDLLIQKAVFLKGVRGQVERLRDELVRMRCFLKDADEKQDEDERIRNWVSEIRAAAYDSEDVIETYIQEIESQKQANFPKKMFHSFRKVGSLSKVGKEIESIQGRIRDIADGREKFGIKNLGEGTSRRDEELQRLRRSSPFTEEKDVVGLEEKTRSLVLQLLKEEKCRSVVSVIGMGGVGKTTLARKVYNHSDVRARFDCRAWVCVSQNYCLKDILGGIIKQVKKPSSDLLDMLEKMQEPDLEQMLFQELKDKCYLIVLDDIWKEEAWDCLARAFPVGDKSNRLLLTSRNQDVPLHADRLSVPYELKTLGPEDSWRLFLKRAFGDHVDSGSVMELEDVGRQIARRCAGLPLAITVIGGLLARKKTLGEWKRVLNSISTHLSKGQIGVSGMLALSYNDLPSHLKSCFLYFGFFPEDSEVRTRKLFQLWIAEGLIQQKGTETLEGVAADILDELISRNMVQVAALSADETVKSCRTHDLLRELAITKAAEEIFLEIDGVGDAQFSAKARHLAVHCHSERYTLKNSIPHVRSLLFFIIDRVTDVGLDFTSFKLLRVLDLENMDIECLPEDIGEISHLRFLGLRFTKITKLPSSLGRLRSLQTLDVYTLTVVEVPDVIWKLENLRNLYMGEIKCKLPPKIDTLRNLQTLSIIGVSDLMHNNLLKLTSLHKLGVRILGGSEIDKLFNSIAELENLQSLALFTGGNIYPSLVGLSKLCHLNKLRLSGDLTVLPSPHHFPPNLTYLSLEGTDLGEDPMRILAKIKQLSVLKLNSAYKGRQIAIQENSFPRLKHFTLNLFLQLEDIALGKGAMPELRCLRIKNCWHLKMLPEELKRLTSLQRLEIIRVPKPLITRIQGVDWYKVCHVPVVILKELTGLEEKIVIGELVYRAALEFIKKNGSKE